MRHIGTILTFLVGAVLSIVFTGAVGEYIQLDMADAPSSVVDRLLILMLAGLSFTVLMGVLVSYFVRNKSKVAVQTMVRTYLDEIAKERIDRLVHKTVEEHLEIVVPLLTAVAQTGPPSMMVFDAFGMFHPEDPITGGSLFKDRFTRDDPQDSDASASDRTTAPDGTDEPETTTASTTSNDATPGDGTIRHDGC